MLRFLKTLSSSRERSDQVIPESTTSITKTVIVTRDTWGGKKVQARDCQLVLQEVGVKKQNLFHAEASRVQA